jgi:hypothetical protein
VLGEGDAACGRVLDELRRVHPLPPRPSLVLPRNHRIAGSP